LCVLYFILISRLSNIFPSLVLSENGEEDVVDDDNDDDADNNAKDANNNYNGNNDTTENEDAEIMPPKVKPAAAQTNISK
jgi:hypothetical protein